jgi:hypothetical protein
MSSWGNNDNAANAPYWAVSSVVTTNAPTVSAPTAANVALLYGNTQFQAYTTNETVGLFLVDAAETISGGDKVVDISLSNQGSGYVEAPGVQIVASAGAYSATATASIAGGKVSNIAVSNTGIGYTSTPAVTITQPVLTITTARVITANDTIMYTAHGQANAAALVYNWGGSSNIGGLLNGTTYYAAPLDANRFQLSTTAANAANAVVINLTTTGQSTQYFDIVDGVRATAVADRGLSQGQSGAEHATHIGWNLKTVGAGGRAGRVQFETLVALANPIGDGSDDLSLPDA